ncbi:MAG: hypothetical protein WD042_05060 [Phycisphaeraceae bacterium]
MSNIVEQKLLHRIRFLIALVIVGLVLSGVTAFALETEMRWLTDVLGIEAGATGGDRAGLTRWLVTVRDALIDTNARYPFIAYGTDWLAFAHLAIAVFFIGPLIDPRRNVWIIIAGLIACAGVILLALFAGQIRGIPLGWRLIDCSFGVLCAVPLILCWRWIGQLERIAPSV